MFMSTWLHCNLQDYITEYTENTHYYGKEMYNKVNPSRVYITIMSTTVDKSTF